MNPEAFTSDIQLFHGKLKMPLVQLPLTSALVTLSTGKVLLAPHHRSRQMSCAAWGP